MPSARAIRSIANTPGSYPAFRSMRINVRSLTPDSRASSGREIPLSLRRRSSRVTPMPITVTAIYGVVKYDNAFSCTAKEGNTQ